MATRAQANKAISILIAAYPSANKADGEIMTQFLSLLERTLEPYPAEVLAELISPRSGIICTNTFLPSIAEVKSWCDAKWDKLVPRPVGGWADANKQLYGPADVETPAEREACRAIVKVKFQELMKELRLTNISTPMRK